MNKGLRVLSLFDGISCGRVALERVGLPVNEYIAYEIDSSAIKVSEHNYADIVHCGDVTKADYTEYKGIDLLMGGSPCTNFSSAGNRKGAVTDKGESVTTYEDYIRLKESGVSFEGQSYLFWEYVRALREVKPTYFLFENVKMKKEWRDIITEALGVESILINSKKFSVQSRERLYWTNIPINQEDLENRDCSLVLKDIVRECDNSSHHLSEKHKQGFLRNYKWRGLSLEEKSTTLLASYYKQPAHCPYIECNQSESGYRMLSPIECERLQTLPDNYTDCVSKTQRYKSLGNCWTVDVISYILQNLKNKETEEEKCGY